MMADPAPDANSTRERATVEQLWAWLAEVPDPEIPVISVVDLGIVRDVHWSQPADRAAGEAECVVTVTPTYSGCPATEVIARDIETALRRHGVARVRLRVQLSPAWTTAWLSAAGQQKLTGYGIAPPARQVIDISRLGRGARQPADAVAPEVNCPRCGSRHTTVLSQFGSTPCKALYRCNDCLEPFDYFKDH
jgi:ring-1,2-phenylacetyl-CoA epoxidase subunit PaaD